jgi:uncharacterized protein YdcH (DUF465 family)
MSVGMREAELREQLMSTNREFKRLADEHKAYAEQLEVLSQRPYLSETERIQEIDLKKKKLMAKDRMYSIVQKYLKEMTARS